eukprot:SAG22_NODE_12535_length_438_cov_1.572271_1_plen_81_part_00
MNPPGGVIDDQAPSLFFRIYPREHSILNRHVNICIELQKGTTLDTTMNISVICNPRCARRIGNPANPSGGRGRSQIYSYS